MGVQLVQGISVHNEISSEFRLRHLETFSRKYASSPSAVIELIVILGSRNMVSKFKNVCTLGITHNAKRFKTGKDNIFSCGIALLEIFNIIFRYRYRIYFNYGRPYAKVYTLEIGES